jgi:hypothetical protein
LIDQHAPDMPARDPLANREVLRCGKNVPTPG